MKKITILLGFILIILSSCTQKIDGSSQQKMASSINEITESLDPEKKEKFKEALGLIMFQGLNLKDLMEDNTEKVASDVRSKLDGKTADEIIEEGEKIQAKKEIGELYNKKEEAKKEKMELAKFKVKNPRFYKKSASSFYNSEKSVIQLTVINGTDKAISKAYFSGVLTTPNRSVPWVKGIFNYKIPGGLEPGEEVTWRLVPNMLSDWADTKAKTVKNSNK